MMTLANNETIDMMELTKASKQPWNYAVRFVGLLERLPVLSDPRFLSTFSPDY